jgi:hypothetical protein
VGEFGPETRRYSYTMDDALPGNDGRKVYLISVLVKYPLPGWRNASFIAFHVETLYSRIE